MPPSNVTLQINGAATITGDLLVDLTISATGATEMRISNNGFSWASWQPFATSVLSWDLRGYGGNANEGVKSTWLEVRDALNDVVQVYASIIYRRAKPSIKLYPAPVQRAGKGPVDISLIVYEPHFLPVHVVEAEYTLDGTFTDGKNISFLPNDPGHDGTTDLQTAPNGISHNLVWDPYLDFEDDVSDITQVRIMVAYSSDSRTQSELGVSQQFLCDVREDIEIADLRFTRGDSAEIKLVLLDRQGAPFDATGDVEITSIKDPSGQEKLVTPITAVRNSTGYYTAIWPVPNDAPLGLWLSKWEYTADNVDHEDVVYFSIVEETESYTPVGADTCVVYGQLFKADQTPLDNREIHFIPHHLSDPELGNPTSISTNTVVVYTDDDGRFKVELIKNTELIMYIPSLSFRQFAKVPDQNTTEYRGMMTILPVPPRDQFGNRL